MGTFKVEPHGETQVREWFAAHLHEFEYSIVESKTGFPDYVLEDEEGNRIETEAEYRSENFLQHKHSLKGCDMVVCWKHTANMPLLVLELSTKILHKPGQGAVPWSRPRKKKPQRPNLSIYAAMCEEQVEEFKEAFVEDLQAQSRWQDFMGKPRSRLHSATHKLLIAMREVGADDEIEKVAQFAHPQIHPDNVAEYIGWLKIS